MMSLMIEIKEWAISKKNKKLTFNGHCGAK